MKLSLENCAKTIWNPVLTYIYTKNLDFLSADNVEPVLEIAHRFELKGLEEACLKLIWKTKGPVQVLIIAELQKRKLLIIF